MPAACPLSALHARPSGSCNSPYARCKVNQVWEIRTWLLDWIYVFTIIIVIRILNYDNNYIGDHDDDNNKNKNKNKHKIKTKDKTKNKDRNNNNNHNNNNNNNINTNNINSDADANK